MEILAPLSLEDKKNYNAVKELPLEFGEPLISHLEGETKDNFIKIDVVLSGSSDEDNTPIIFINLFSEPLKIKENAEVTHSWMQYFLKRTDSENYMCHDNANGDLNTKDNVRAFINDAENISWTLKRILNGNYLNKIDVIKAYLGTNNFEEI